MLEFLRGLASKFSNVVLVQENQLPLQAEQDYEDLTHVGPTAQVRFTKAIASVLAEAPRQP
jgi:hypothetical protein